MKNSVLDYFPLCPLPNPLMKNANFIFIVVSLSLTDIGEGFGERSSKNPVSPVREWPQPLHWIASRVGALTKAFIRWVPCHVSTERAFTYWSLLRCIPFPKLWQMHLCYWLRFPWAVCIFCKNRCRTFVDSYNRERVDKDRISGTKKHLPEAGLQGRVNHEVHIVNWNAGILEAGKCLIRSLHFTD